MSLQIAKSWWFYIFLTFFTFLLTFCFLFQQLLSLWICEEKELVHEIAGLGELKSPWHKCQMAWLENHLNIINTYSQALETLDNYKGNIFCLPLWNILRLRSLKSNCRALQPYQYYSLTHYFNVIGLVNNADKAAVLYNWLENHLNIINTYSQALETLDNYKGNIFSTPPKHP